MKLKKIGLVLGVLVMSTSLNSQTSNVKVDNGPILVQDRKWFKREIAGEAEKQIYFLNKGTDLSQMECVNSKTLQVDYKVNINIPNQYLVAPDGVYGFDNNHLYYRKGKLVYLGENFEKKKFQQVVGQTFDPQTGAEIIKPLKLCDEEVIKKKPKTIRFIESTDSSQIMILKYFSDENKFTFLVVDFNLDIVNRGELELPSGTDLYTLKYNSDGTIYFLTELKDAEKKIKYYNKFFIQNIKKNNQKSYELTVGSNFVSHINYKINSEKIVMAGVCKSSNNDKGSVFFASLDNKTPKFNIQPKVIASELSYNGITENNYFSINNIILKENGGAYVILEEKGRLTTGTNNFGNVHTNTNNTLTDRSRSYEVAGSILVFNYDENDNFKWEKKIEKSLILYYSHEVDQIDFYSNIFNNDLVFLYNLRGADSRGRMLNLTMTKINEQGDYSSSKIIEYPKEEPFIFTSACASKIKAKSLISFQRQKQNYKFIKLSLK